MYHGAALTQIAEHPQFTAINAFSTSGKISRSSFLVNNDIAIYLKYAKEPKGTFDEYLFTFNEEHLKEIKTIHKKAHKAFVVLVCVKDRQICCISHDEIFEMIDERKRRKKAPEKTYTILVTVPKSKSLRVYMNAPGKKKVYIKERVISRSKFPTVVFEESENT